jgi:hypothetical protein
MDSTAATEDEFNYHLTLVSFNQDANIDIERVKNNMRQILLDRGLCDIGFFANPFPPGLVINYKFSAPNGSRLFTLIFTANDCPAAQPTE